MVALHTACAKAHTLVPIADDIYACECPSVFRREGKFFLDPARKGLLDDVLHVTASQGGLAAMARKMEQEEHDRRAERREKAEAAKRDRKRSKVKA